MKTYNVLQSASYGQWVKVKANNKEEAIEIANSIVSAVKSNELLETHLESAQMKTTYWGKKANA